MADAEVKKMKEDARQVNHQSNDIELRMRVVCSLEETKESFLIEENCVYKTIKRRR